MIQDASFQRKIIYLGLIALLLIPLYMIGHPRTGDPADLASSPGGQLAQLRSEHGLAPSELGEVDPASESMKLATLGMRGIAANILWTKANHYKKTEDWEKLVASVNQMAKLQPNFVSVWEFQSHNLSYNISVEHDDYRFRYLWVKKGIEFLLKGTRYNRREPKLFWTVGWYTGQKFGRADEHRQFRTLFPDDLDFHNKLNEHDFINMDEARGGREFKPDNWLTSRLWYNQAYTLQETGQGMIRGKAPHIFYSDGPKALMNYANAIEEEGILDEVAGEAWRFAGDEWDKFSKRVVPHSSGLMFSLSGKEEAIAEGERLRAQFEEMLPNLRNTLREEKRAKLTDAEREILDKPEEEVTEMRDMQRRYEATQKIGVVIEEMAARAPTELRAKAHRLAKLTRKKEEEARKIRNYRDNVNFDYWAARCQIEQMRETVAARHDVFEAKKKMQIAKLEEARQLFENAWKTWAEILNEHPVLVGQLTEEDLFEDVQKYVELLGQLDEELPETFALQSVLDKYHIEDFEGGIPTGDPAEVVESMFDPELGRARRKKKSPKDELENEKKAKEAPLKGDDPDQDSSKAKAEGSDSDATKTKAKPAEEKAAAKENAKPADAAEKKSDVKKPAEAEKSTEDSTDSKLPAEQSDAASADKR